MTKAPLLLPALVIIVVVALVGARKNDEWKLCCPQHPFVGVKLMETPQPSRRSLHCSATVVTIDGNPSSGSIELFFRPDSMAFTLRYGDCLLMHAYPDTARGSLYVTSDHYIVTSRDSTSLRSRIESVRLNMLNRLYDGPLPVDEVGVVAALTLGFRSYLSSDVRQAFRGAGLSHLMAVSGLHTGLLAAIVGLLLWGLGCDVRGRSVRAAAQVLSMWAFSALTGFSPSVIRSSLMFSLFAIADALGRRTPKINLLSLSAIITLLASPQLLFDVGWQLSYAAVAGILLARPLIMAFQNRFYQTAAASLSATVATFPVVALSFRSFYPYFLMANVVVLPLSGLLLALCLAYMAVPCSATAFVLHPLLMTIDWFVGLVSSLPGAVLSW